MSRLYLPTSHSMGGVKINSNPYPSPKTKREELLHRLYETKTCIPDGRTMPLEELEDHVVAQEEKMQQGYYDKVAPAKKTEPMSDKQYEQTVGAIKEYLAWKNKRLKSWGLRR